MLEQLASVSSLLTGHPTAAANAIRSLLEVLLDDLSVPREEQRPGKSPRTMTLHERLDKHQAITGSHHDGLMALKLFGNAGSHGGQPIEQGHLEDACQVLEQLIMQLYQPRSDVSKQIARLNENFRKKTSHSSSRRLMCYFIHIYVLQMYLFKCFGNFCRSDMRKSYLPRM